MITDSTALAFTAPPRRFVWGWNKPQAVGIVSPSYETEKLSYALTPRVAALRGSARVRCWFLFMRKPDERALSAATSARGNDHSFK